MVTFPLWIIRTTDEVNAQDECHRGGQHWAFTTPDKADEFIHRVAPHAAWEIREVQRDGVMQLIIELNAKRIVELCLDPESNFGGSVIRLSDIARAMSTSRRFA